MVNKIRYSCLLFCTIVLGSFAQSPAEFWVDSVMNTMDEDRLIGQLFMIRAHSDLGAEHIQSVKNQIDKYHVGGLCFFQGSPLKQAILTNEYQDLSEIPLLVAIDAEWGLGMRFKEAAISFPRQLSLGAVQDNYLIYEMGREVARQLLRIGTHVNFAPVVDINNNPLNPVINDRSFGEDRYNVATKSYMYMRGMQNEGIIACAKHFPGHGDTDVDSHLDLPVINHTLDRLDSLELYPFKSLIQHGLKGIMVAHLNVPTLDNRPNLPTTLSRNTITDLLQEKMRFNGLIFTDALEMKGVTKHYASGEVEALAFLAGNDMLVLPQNIEDGINTVRQYLQEGKISLDQIKSRVRKILKTKYSVNLHRYHHSDISDIDKDVNNPNAIALKSRLIEKAITLINNEANLIPFRNLKDHNFASVAIGSSDITPFQNTLSKYATFSHFQISKETNDPEINKLIKKLEGKNTVVVSLHDMNKYANRQFGLTASTLRLIEKISATGKKVVLVVFGSPYSLKYFAKISHLICAYEEDEMFQDITAQALFGAIPFEGRIPVSASPDFPFNWGLNTPGLQRLGYSIPERTGLSSDSLELIKNMVANIISTKAAPGCQILVAKDRKVIFHEAFGYHTYDKIRKVKRTDLYDLASITKVAATTISMMKLYEEGLVNLDQELSTYLPEVQKSNKNGITIAETMSHHGGLIGWIPFYRETMIGSRRNVRPHPEFYRNTASKIYNVPVAQNLYLKNTYQDTIWNRIIESNLRSTKSYRYSDLGFYLLNKIIRQVTEKELDQYVLHRFYEPLGLKRITFNPLTKFVKKEIVPTEHDNYFRGQEVHGYVHDMGAAMLGGVSGHAGLFSDSYSLAVLMQMLLNEGDYGGIRYLDQATIQKFTTRYIYSSRRGIGFDMKEMDANKKPNMSAKASQSTYGHTGFTGTCVWADPALNLIFVFLSNRTYPNSRVNKLNKESYREKLHTLVYNALLQ